MKLKNSTKLSLILLALLLLTSCNPSEKLGRKALDQARLSLANKEYEKSLSSFNLAKEEGINSKEIDDLISILDKYLKSIDFLEEGKIEEAYKSLNAIDESYRDYDIKADIDRLTKKVNELRLIEGEYREVISLANKDNLEEAVELKKEADQRASKYSNENYFLDLKNKAYEKIIDLKENREKEEMIDEMESDAAAGMIEIKLSKMEIEEAERLVAAYYSDDPYITLDEFNDDTTGIQYEDIVIEEGTNEPWYWINVFQKTGNFRISNYFIHPETKEIRDFIMTRD